MAVLMIPAPSPDMEVVITGDHAPLVKGHGFIDYACHSCTTVLLRDIESMRYLGAIVKCPNCSELNAVPQS